MIYPARFLIKETVDAASEYEFVLEEELTVKWLLQPTLRMFNPLGTTCKFRVRYTISESDVFSHTYTPVNDEAVPAGQFLDHDIKVPIIRDSGITHTVRMKNEDGVSRLLYCLLSGFVDVKTVLSNYVGNFG